MKVLMVNKFLHHNGGSETYIFELGKKLQEEGHLVEYFGMDDEKRVVGNSIDCYTNSMNFHTNKIKKLLYPFKIIYSTEAKMKMEKVLNHFQPDIVHLNNFNFQLTPSIIYAVQKYKKTNHPNVKLVFTAHDYQLVCPNHMMKNGMTGENCELCVGGKYGACIKNKCIHNSTSKSILGAVEGLLYKYLKTYRFIDLIICPSEFLQEKLNKNPLLKNKTIALHNFVEKNQAVATEKKDYILYFGRFSEEKGVKTLAAVCKQLPHIQFIFAGGGPLKDTIDAVENIHNVGFIIKDELETLIKEAKFSIYPSEWYENCPFSVMESQIYGTPVLGADIGGIPEIIEVGKTGILFEAGNEEDLKAKIELLWKDSQFLAELTKGCESIEFDNLEEYCNKLIHLYQTT